MFDQRRVANGRYSLRAFARDTGVKAGPLSEIMAGKRRLTRSTAARILGGLGIDNRRQAQILSSIAERSRMSASLPGVMLRGPRRQHLTLVSDDIFSAIAEPCHYYFLSLMQTVDFESDPAWIAERLATSERKVHEIIDRLVRLQIIAKNKDTGDLVALKTNLVTTTDVPSAALRQSHKVSIEEGMVALENIPLNLRDISSATIALDASKIPEAKKIIRQFRAGMSEFLEDGVRTEVYNLNIQLVPVTKLRAMEPKV